MSAHTYASDAWYPTKLATPEAPRRQLIPGHVRAGTTCEVVAAWKPAQRGYDA